jgi:hypothetical protein
VVWITGGSAAFGIGQRDDHTIASELVRLAAEEGIALDVHNLAVPGWTLWQEYQGVLARLATDAPRPDLVVFYDGFNDGLFTLTQTVVDGPAWDRPVVNRATDATSAGARYSALSATEVTSAISSAGGPAEIGRRAADRYARLRDLIEAQLGSDGVATAFAFQPDAYASTTQVGAVRFEPGYQATHADPLGPLLEAMSRRLQGSVIDLRHALDDETREVFIDIAHTGERGAAIVASALYDRLRPVLEQRATASGR